MGLEWDGVLVASNEITECNWMRLREPERTAARGRTFDGRSLGAVSSILSIPASAVLDASPRLSALAPNIGFALVQEHPPDQRIITSGCILQYGL